ncbi:hypothetical protein JD844_001370 [Phrynosoma platyrhinos]|uniref:Aspartyl/asparaginy/proline hydroxylase domain-containing protein n=1 Tax=Phrynosoma platyrhinos TaxID=52577 RepID=A0ABQ7T9R1_PHRPL|nr:hypothetical protein JD844_001370 [Phrynosoma platyrhinos]
MPCIMADWGLHGLLSPLLPDTSSWRPRPEPAIAVLGSLALLFIWYCYRVGSGQAAPISHQQGMPTEERCPRRALRGDAANPRLYRSLRDYAKRYSWSGMNRLHKGIRDQAHYQLGERPAIQKPSTFYLPDLPSAPYFPRESQRHDVEILELSFPAILREFEGISWDFGSGAPTPRGWTANAHPGWHSYYLYRQGECIVPNCRSCPWTYRALSALRTFVNANRFGNACFSVLQPGTVLPGTYGPTNTRVRCHLGEQMPEEQGGGGNVVLGFMGTCACGSLHCQSSLSTVELLWFLIRKLGIPKIKYLVQSESYSKEMIISTMYVAGSSTDGPRVIFIVDLWHPNVAGPERQALDYIFAPGR